VETDCKAERDACAGDDACVELDACVSGCGDTLQCLGTCAEGFTEGLTSYLALANCIRCESCSGFCEGCGLLHCVNGMVDGSESAVDCGGADCAGCAQGQSCTTGDDCETGYCADGVCCDGACGGVCESCVMATTGQPDGECHLIAQGTDPEDECSLADVCNGAGDCQCTDGQQNFGESDVDCGGANCPGCATGQTCDDNGDCASSHCVDGICCNTACGGLCESCLAADTGGTDGTCAPIPSGSDPDNECTAQSQSTCGTTGLCSGSGTCAFWSSSTPCGSTQSCSGGIETKQDYCNGAGTCIDNGTVACAPYSCGTTACAVTCSISNPCNPGYYCDTNNQCQALKPNGTTCVNDNECTSAQCTDNVCCNVACGGTCQSCLQMYTGVQNGQCAAIPDNADPQNECTAQAPSTCGTTGVCNGASACKLHPPATPCGSSQSCVGSTQTNQDTCNGAGTCIDNGTTNCSPYTCNTSSCFTSCSQQTQCVGTHYCNGSQCVAKKAQGSTCSQAYECSSGFCVDGFCCNQACNGGCMACSQALSGAPNGTCNWFANGADPQNECGACKYCNGSGSCVNAPIGTNPKGLCPGCCNNGGFCGGTWNCTNGCGFASSWGECTDSGGSNCSNQQSQCASTHGQACDCPGQGNQFFESGSAFQCGGGCPSCGQGYVCTQWVCACQ
jgi:hypothetical protein